MTDTRRRSPRPRVAGADTLPQAPSRVPVPRVEISIEREAGAEISRVVTLDAEVGRVGSHPSNDVALADPRVSRFHCTLRREATGWRVSDADSLNGTWLAGVRVWEAELPMPECRIELGDSVIRVRELPSQELVEVPDAGRFGALVGESVAMRKLFALLERVARSDATVLIEGESGTGKDLVATELVRRGQRSDAPFIVVDCGGISPNLIESELFGHVRGAFTGADRERQGAFEAANGGTVFLDEIGEMPIDMQPKLLRALEAREIRRVGETRPRSIDVRVIAATNRRLEREVNRGKFRDDLYFRLSVVTIRVPPLRDHIDDLRLLVGVFLDALESSHAAGLFTPRVLAEMASHAWPGNVRELRNYVERAVVLEGASSVNGPEWVGSAVDSTLAPIDVDVPFNTAKQQVVADFERRYLTALLELSQGNVTRAAQHAKMDRMNLHRLVQIHGLRAGRGVKD